MTTAMTRENHPDEGIRTGQATRFQIKYEIENGRLRQEPKKASRGTTAAH